MAGDWIKVECTTPDKPEVIKMARVLGISRDEVLGKLIRFWCWVDANSVDGTVDGVVDADVDALVDALGFCKCLSDARWIIIDVENETIHMLNHHKHNSETAKKRALKNKRQTRYRQKNNEKQQDNAQDTHVDTHAPTNASTREEKRREDNNKNSSCEEFSSEHVEVANLIHEKILELYPKRKKPNIGKWANTVRLMVERDKRTCQEIIDLFLWANNDPFWCANILGPDKLRKQWDQLTLKKMRQGNGETNKTISAGQSIRERAIAATLDWERERSNNSGVDYVD